MDNNEVKIKREVLLDSLCYNYGKDKFLNWCRSLRYFRFCKSHPYPDDLKPDRFIALTSFENEAELTTFCNSLEINAKIEGGKILNSNDSNSTFYGKAAVFGVYCYVNVNKILKTLLLEVSGTESDQFLLDDTTFQRAKQIDENLSALEIEFISSPYEDDYCITPKFYPEVWK